MNAPAGEMPTSVYIRDVVIPPAAPWVQRQAAELEATTGAPLGAATLFSSVRRLEAWRPGKPGLYAIAYIRAGDLGESRVVATHAGDKIAFHFRPPAAARRRLQASAPLMIGGLAAVLGLGLAGQQALSIRAEREQALVRLEANASKWERRERADRRTQAQLRGLREADADGRGFADLAADLFWLGQAKAPEARFEEIVWRKGEMRVRSTAAGEPVVGRERAVTAAEGEHTWRIGAAPVPVIKNGLTRPSVVASRAPIGTEGAGP